MVAAGTQASTSTTRPGGGGEGRLADEAPSDRPSGPERILVPASEPWGVEYPFRSRFFAPGNSGNQRVWLHYVDEGPRDAPVIVFLHGNPTWSFMWRKLIVALRDRFRCIAPDHLGMGLSDRPQQWPYTLANRVGDVSALLDALDIQRFSLVVHDWGGAIGMGVATERPESVDKLVVANTAAFRSTEIPPSIASVRIPVFGRVAVLRFNAFAYAATIRAVEKPLSAHAKAGLLAPYSNPHDRISTLKFVEDIPMKPSHVSWDRLTRIEEKLPLLADKPMQLIWGDKDFCFTPRFRARWQSLFPNARVQAFDDAGHYVYEDEPGAVDVAARFLSEG